ncbi:acyl-CoA dehydratase activase-related protein [Caloranaerobacter sp. DY30410]|uniref:acyl-CoA dehydratase activase-related protein n=1 Tax=Caloranaerobacter sp. DY30410 TaxID=3238305 RepID=UPI003CFE3322
MKIGIPKALLYYYYGPFWETFFEELGMEVVVSEDTNKKLINEGIKASVPEICVPIKIFIGHCIDLTKKDVDYIFVPRMVSIYKGEVFCPKFMGLPDMLIHGVEGMEGKILTCHIKSKSDDISDYKNYINIAEKLKISQDKLKKACEIASEKWYRFREYNKKGYHILEAIDMVNNNIKLESMKKSDSDVKLGILGYVYNMYDGFVNMNIIDKLKDLNVDFITFDMIDESELRKYIDDMDKVLFWTFSNKLLGAGYKFFRENEVDGIIHITAFGCGPDSFLGKLFEIESDDTKIPFMTIRVDEHTGENHLQTRIEAFVDMIRRKKAKAVMGG